MRLDTINTVRGILQQRHEARIPLQLGETRKHVDMAPLRLEQQEISAQELTGSHPANQFELPE